VDRLNNIANASYFVVNSLNYFAKTGLILCSFLVLSLVRYCYNIYYHMEYTKWVSFKLDNWLNNFRVCEIHWEFSSQSAYQCKVLILYLLLSYKFGCERNCIHSLTFLASSLVLCNYLTTNPTQRKIVTHKILFIFACRLCVCVRACAREKVFPPIKFWQVTLKIHTTTSDGRNVK
jgi:hypothetical protein